MRAQSFGFSPAPTRGVTKATLRARPRLRERDAQLRARRERRGYAGNDFEIDPGLAQSSDLFLRPPE